MHNRLKVRTSAEIQAINKKREQEKAHAYALTMKELLEKRNGDCYDSIMLLSAEIIHMNPDVATVWNIRKECLLKCKDDDAEKRKSVVNEELKLTEAGLRVNPKSYCAWFHRSWILDNFGTKEDWTKELYICTKYLEMDERNFHCWDYRKYIVGRLNTQLEKELDFTLQKLSSNFSNYSAWHYRSTLIPRIHPIFEQNNLFESDIYRQEVSMVENAVYTDPNDQSAWFYHRWLLSYLSNPAKFIQAGFNRNASLIWVVIYPINSRLQVRGFGDDPWEFLNGKKYSNVFVKKVQLDEVFSECIKLVNEKDEIIDSLVLTSNHNAARELNLKSVLTAEQRKGYEQQLTSFKLLVDMDANSKWPSLASVVLCEKLGHRPDKLILEKLQVVDNYRKNFYSDIISRHEIETILSSITNFQGSFIGSSHGLTALHHNFCFTLFKEVDLSNNPLGNNVIRQLDVLLSCETLNLSECCINSIDEFPALSNLKDLNISNNEISCHKLPTGLLKCSKLELLKVSNSSIQWSQCEEINSTLKNLRIELLVL